MNVERRDFDAGGGGCHRPARLRRKRGHPSHGAELAEVFTAIGIMAARTKPLNVVAPGGATEGTGVSKFELPPAKGDCKMISADTPEELVRLLREEAKVL